MLLQNEGMHEGGTGGSRLVAAYLPELNIDR